MSLLPPLCPIVGKAPTLASRPRQKSPTTSQQTLYSLLKRRHERYLAHRDSIATLHAACSTSTMKFAVAPQRSNPQEMSDKGIIEQQCSAMTEANLLSKLECSDLAEYVVHRAKVRLKRRYNKGRTHSVITGEQNILEVHSAKANLCASAIGNSNTANLCASAIGNSNTANLCASAIGNSNTVLVQGGKSRHLSRAGKSKSADVTSSKDNSKQYRSLDFRLPPLPGKSLLTAADVGASGISLDGLAYLHNATASRTTTACSKLYSSKPDEMVVEPRPQVVYLSEKHSNTPKATGIPNAPPATPAGVYSQSFKFIPSLHDIKSQRLLKNRLEEIIEKLKEKSLHAGQVASGEERKVKEAVARLKAKQRAEIYALNKIMEEYEEQKFQAFLSPKV